MKVAFDEHVPPAMARILIDFAKAKTVVRKVPPIQICLAKDYVPDPQDTDYASKSDVPWINRFSSDGGRAIISGDVKMRAERKHEMLALLSSGLVVVSFERAWGGWKFFHKTGLMVHWWKEIVSKIYDAAPGTFWVVPNAWPRENGELRNVSLGLAKMLPDNPSRSGAKRKKARKKPSKRDNTHAQGSFLTNLEGTSAKNGP